MTVTSAYVLNEQGRPYKVDGRPRQEIVDMVNGKATGRTAGELTYLVNGRSDWMNHACKVWQDANGVRYLLPAATR